MTMAVKYDIYDSARDDLWRFTLGKTGARPLLVVGLNPSTATQEAADTTVAKVETVAARSGFDGFVMLNLYPVRATDYRELPADVNRQAFATNLAKIEAVVAGVPDPVLWAAWGNPVEHHSFFMDARDALRERLARYAPKWQCFGAPTTRGHPRHPSRLQYAWEFRPYAWPAA